MQSAFLVFLVGPQPEMPMADQKCCVQTRKLRQLKDLFTHYIIYTKLKPLSSQKA